MCRPQEVDAAPRMPVDIFNDTAAVARYVEVTKRAWAPAGDPRVFGLLVNEPCDHDPTRWFKNGSGT